MGYIYIFIYIKQSVCVQFHLILRFYIYFELNNLICFVYFFINKFLICNLSILYLALIKNLMLKYCLSDYCFQGRVNGREVIIYIKTLLCKNIYHIKFSSVVYIKSSKSDITIIFHQPMNSTLVSPSKIRKWFTFT